MGPKFPDFQTGFYGLAIFRIAAAIFFLRIVRRFSSLLSFQTAIGTNKFSAIQIKAMCFFFDLFFVSSRLNSRSMSFLLFSSWCDVMLWCDDILISAFQFVCFVHFTAMFVCVLFHNYDDVFVLRLCCGVLLLLLLLLLLMPFASDWLCNNQQNTCYELKCHLLHKRKSKEKYKIRQQNTFHVEQGECQNDWHEKQCDRNFSTFPHIALSEENVF